MIFGTPRGVQGHPPPVRPPMIPAFYMHMIRSLLRLPGTTAESNIHFFVRVLSHLKCQSIQGICNGVYTKHCEPSYGKQVFVAFVRRATSTQTFQFNYVYSNCMKVLNYWYISGECTYVQLEVQLRNNTGYIYLFIYRVNS